MTVAPLPERLVAVRDTSLAVLQLAVRLPSTSRDAFWLEPVTEPEPPVEKALTVVLWAPGPANALAGNNSTNVCGTGGSASDRCEITVLIASITPNLNCKPT